MNKELNSETFLCISPSKFRIYLFDVNGFKNLYFNELIIKKNSKFIDLNLLKEFLDNNIYKIEKYIGKFIENVFVIINNEKILSLDIGIKKNGYVFLISSYIIKQPTDELIISSSLRSGFSSLFKSLSIIYSKKNIKFINIAPGPIKTKRLINLIKKDGLTINKFAKQLPGKKIPEASEIGKFVNFVVQNKITSLNGNTITFDSNLIKGL